MVNYRGTCVICYNEIAPKYNYCYKCLQEEKQKGNNPRIKYDPCEKCLGEDCVCCGFS